MDEKISNRAIMVTNEQKKSLVRVIGPKKIFGPIVAYGKTDRKF